MGKSRGVPGVRGQDAREKWKKTVGARCSGPGLAQEMKEKSFFYRESEGAFEGKCDQGRLVLDQN